MDDRQNNAEQKFFQWLPSAVSPSALKDIQTSYIQINALLVKSRVLLRPIVNVTSIRQIRPVFKEELDYFGFNEHWTYPDTDAARYFPSVRQVHPHDLCRGFGQCPAFP